MKPETLVPMMLLLPLFAAPATMLLAPQRKQVFAWAMFITIATFGLSLGVLWLAYAAEPGAQTARIMTGGYFLDAVGAAWVEDFGLRLSFGLDSISLWLILLTTALMPLVILASFTAVTDRVKEYYAWLLVLEAAMIGTFIATDIIFFYICFEFTLVPLYFLIGIFGSDNRLRAARVFFLYTFTGSMLTFAGLLYVAWFNASLDPNLFAGAGTWTFYIPTLYDAAAQMSGTQQMWVLLALMAGFAVKVPLFPVHTWLPLAHTEAPTAGSVILAGVLLKLGTYGLLRFALPMCPQACVVAAPWIGALAVAGILYAGLICWVQRDIKRLIAYSSVSHLGFCVLGLFAIDMGMQLAPDGAGMRQHIGQSGAVMYMINHGLSTGALFLCVGMIYERFHTRRMADMGGLGAAMPIWASFFVFFCLASVGLPGLNGFVGEFLTLLGAFLAEGTLGFNYALLAGIGMIVGAIYILYMVGRVVWGPTKIPHTDHGDDAEPDEHAGHGSHGGVRDLSMREIAVLAPLAVLCVWLGLYPAPVLETLDPPIARLMSPAVEAFALQQESRPAPVDSPPQDTHASPDEPHARSDDTPAPIAHQADGEAPVDRDTRAPGDSEADGDAGVNANNADAALVSLSTASTPAGEGHAR